MQLTILGSGTSGGVPRITGDWGRCDPADPRNRRTRASILVEHEGFVLLVDTSPDLREQLLTAAIRRVDAVVWTHDHADHCHGIDDLRGLRGTAAPIPGYGSSATLTILKHRFAYIFEDQAGYRAVCAAHPLTPTIGPFAVQWCEQPHGSITSTALKFEVCGINIGYSIDFSAITDDMIDLHRGCDLLVVDCLRREPHPTHAHLAMALDLIERCGARRALLSHLDWSMDVTELTEELPRHVRPAVDGQVVTLP